MILTPKNILVFVVLGGIVGLFLTFYVHIHNAFVLNPRRVGSKIGMQGITGPPPSPLLGNVFGMKRTLYFVSLCNPT